MIYEPRLIADLLSRQPWFEVSLRHLEPGSFREAIKWCDEYESDGIYSIGRLNFYFNRSEDAMVFILKWNCVV